MTILSIVGHVHGSLELSRDYTAVVSFASRIVLEHTMDRSKAMELPRFVVFEGVDGSGKTTFAHALKQYYLDTLSHAHLYANSFPGSLPGTLGEWVYRFHHNQIGEAISPALVAPPALQLLHIAAHVDTILTRIIPTFAENGSVILDRYWWSAYSYARLHLPPEQVWPLVNAERIFLQNIPNPVVVYIKRHASLKSQELSLTQQRKLEQYYQEVVENERKAQISVYEINNDASINDTWTRILAVLHLPYRPFPVL